MHPHTRKTACYKDFFGRKIKKYVSPLYHGLQGGVAMSYADVCEAVAINGTNISAAGCKCHTQMCARQLSLCRESTVSLIRFACAQIWVSNCSISRSEQTPTPSKVSTLRASGYARLPSTATCRLLSKGSSFLMSWGTQCFIAYYILHGQLQFALPSYGILPA